MKPGKIVEKFNINGKTVIFRYPTIKDLDGLLNCINSLVEERAMVRIQKKKTRKEEKEWLLKTLKNIKAKTEVFLVVDIEGKIMGSSGVTKNRGAMAHVGELGISLRKEARGKGMGKRLFKALIREAKKVLKVKIITLEVFGRNSIAQNLYKKCGFKEMGRIKKGVNHYGRFDDLVTMVKYL